MPYSQLKTPIILASSSSYRRQLLKRLLKDFQSLTPEIDETPLANESPKELVRRLAISKAKRIGEQHPSAIIIGADQVAVCQGQILGKPLQHQAAVEQLSFCSGQKAEFLTQVCLYQASSNQLLTDLSQVSLKFLTLTQQQIQAYLLLDKPYDCAGSFKVESYGIRLFEVIESDDPTSLEGLPLLMVNRLLRAMIQNARNNLETY